MSLPGHFRAHTISVEPFDGNGAYGPVFGAAVNVECRVEHKVQLVRSAEGTEVVSSMTVYCARSVTIPPESRVTVDGRTTSVISTADHDTGGRSPLEHKEVLLR